MMISRNMFCYEIFEFMFKPVHSASLAVTRILYGFLMVFDIPDERGGSEIDIRWGDPKSCHFPLFNFMYRPSFPWICILYGIMWLGALGICLGYKFRASCYAYLLPYWYILLLDKSFWNNHSYLYGLIGILLSVSSAGDYWSLDVFLDKNKENQQMVPYWNYFLLKFQLFCLYFLAGLKKLNMEWLEGYAMTNLGKHWVFSSFGFIFSTEQIDFLVIHFMGFLLDLTVGFFLMFERTRPYAFLFCGMFHLMNSRLFSIGMFPYVCLATMPLFCNPDWPLQLITKAKCLVNRTTEKHLERNPKKPKKSINFLEETKRNLENNEEKSTMVSKTANKKKRTLFLIFFYCFVQLFLPWSHFITKGYNNWTNGLYGYSWDMMVHAWDTTLVIVRIVDNKSGKEVFLDPSAWTYNDRWNKHADMSVQYAQCLKRNMQMDQKLSNNDENMLSDNISIYLDVWCSLNGRFQQRMFHPHYDLLQANWSPFGEVEWLLPLLIEYSDFRTRMKRIQEDVYSWSNYSDILFVADFPDLYLENFITKDLINVSLVVIEGSVYYESEDRNQGVRLDRDERIAITSNVFHKIKTISSTPSCFMYTFVNSTKAELQEVNVERTGSSKSAFPLLEDSQETFQGFAMMFSFIGNALLHVLYGVPLVRRARVE